MGSVPQGCKEYVQTPILGVPFSGLRPFGNDPAHSQKNDLGCKARQAGTLPNTGVNYTSNYKGLSVVT